MELRDVSMTAVEEPPSKLRRSVASARPVKPTDDSPDELDMTAFIERMETDIADLDRAEGTTRYKRQRKVRLIKRIRRKHGFKILTVTLLIVLFWLLAIS